MAESQAQGGIVCPECGSTVAPGTQFCGECGAKVPQPPQPTADAPEAPEAPVFKPRPKARTVMGIDSQASKFASALAEVEARAKADGDAKKRGSTGSEADPVADDEAALPREAEADAKARAQAEAEAEAIIARAQADAEKAYAAEDKAALDKTLTLENEGEATSGAAAPSNVTSSKAKTVSFGSVTLGAGADETAEAASEPAANVVASDVASGAGEASAAPESSGAEAASSKVDAAAADAATSNQPPPAAAAAKPAPRVIVPERGTPAAARAAIQASKRGLAHTMLGLSDEVIKAASSMPPAPANPPANKDEAARDALPRGITPVSVTQVNASGNRAGAVATRSAPKGTLLGIQTSPGSIPAPSRSLDRTQIEGEQSDDGGSGNAGYAPSGPDQLGSTRVEGTRGTALGIGIPQATPKRGAPQGRTMLGVPVASIAPPPAADAARSGSTPPREGGSTRAISEAPSSIPPSAPKANARTRNLVIVASLALLTIIAMVYLRLSGGADAADVSARIVLGPDGESLLFEVPDAREGSNIRFGGQEQPLVGGHATFALASDSLRVGENVVLADVVAPDGETSSTRIVLSVFYRIWVDTSSLRVDKPTVDVVVTAVPGTKVTLEGQDVPLDSQGRATKSLAVDIKHPGKGGVIDHVVHYRMQPPKGEAVVEELHTRIAVAMMQIDRPGPDIVTDRESIEIAGAVGRDTQVDIDGAAVPVKDGRFQHTLGLPRPGDYKPRVTAKAPGKVPNVVTLNIKRVRDLAQAAREFNYNKDLGYAKIAADPALYKGQPVAMEGRVYATVPRAGSSVIQMLARPCPTTQRCSVWVVDPQGTEVSIDRYVRILGTLDGEQQFRSEKNEIVTVPKIIARFVLPAKP